MSPNLDDTYIYMLTTCCSGTQPGGGRIRGEKVWSQELRLRPPLGKMAKEAKYWTKMGLGRGPMWSRGTDRLHGMIWRAGHQALQSVFRSSLTT